MSQTETTKNKIVNYLKSAKAGGSKELMTLLGISRQALNVHLRRLVESGVLTKTGSTRNARYHYGKLDEIKETFAGNFKAEGLDEDHVYQRVVLSLNLEHMLRKNIATISAYAFTEMLNNAIDHSASAKIRVRASLDESFFRFEVRDWGKGAYASIAEKFDLADEQDAMIELVKGKTTTMPERHSGEGIFFTSRASTQFILRSHRIQLEWNEDNNDVFASSLRYIKGTQVLVTIRRHSRKTLEKIFARFAPEEFEFEFGKTHVHVNLLCQQYLSRSEAKRLMLNLDRFRVIELDFNQVETVGQGFTDEIFRVFQSHHPAVEMIPRKANPAVAAMIRHAGWK